MIFGFQGNKHPAMNILPQHLQSTNVSRYENSWPVDASRRNSIDLNKTKCINTNKIEKNTKCFLKVF